MEDSREIAAPELGTSGKVAGVIVATLAAAAIISFTLSSGVWNDTRSNSIALPDNSPHSRFETSPNNEEPQP